MNAQYSEALKLSNGILYNLSYHQTRMDRTLARFGGEKISLAEALKEIPTHARQGLFKCRVVYGKHIESVEFTPYTFRRIATVGIVVDDNIAYGYKYTDRSRLDELLKQTGCDDMIIAKQGFVTDAFSSNLVFESNEGLFTPDTYLLPGTKRQFLLDTGRITERQISVNDIRLYERIWFINAMVDLEDNICVDTKELV